METKRDEFLTSLNGRSELLGRIQVLAHRPQFWLHEARWDGFVTQQGQIDDPTLLNRFRKPENPQRLQNRFAEMLNDFFGLREPVDYKDFSAPAARFSLFSPDVLERLAFSIGLVRTSPILKQAIGGGAVSRIIDQIGETAYREAIERAPLTIGTEYEGVPLSVEDLSVNLRTSVTRVGWTSLAKVMSEAPDAIVKRFRLKLSPASEAEFERGLGETEEEPGLTELLVRILKNHVNRRAATCVF